MVTISIKKFIFPMSELFLTLISYHTPTLSYPTSHVKHNKHTKHIIKYGTITAKYIQLLQQKNQT